MLEDTIIAIATPPGRGGLGIVRLSGKNALKIGLKIFKPLAGKIEPRRPIFGRLRDSEKGGFYDEAFLTYFKKPHSYTREDVVEISCHGSPVVLEEAVRLGVSQGARHAQPGEFTLRAYLNGRLDIIQAEAVNDLVHAVSITQAKISFGQLGGRLSKKIVSIRESVIHLLSGIESAIEFPDENLPGSRKEFVIELARLIGKLKDLLSGYDAGRSLVEGIEIAIVGKTNVGKSTLFNALLDEERAIVTPYPGTTRDFLRERILVQDTVFNLVDMAGLGRAAHPVEKEGMRRSERLARNADGVLLVMDASKPAGREDLRLIEKYGKGKALIVLNKIDKPRKFDVSVIKKAGTNISVVEASAYKHININNIKTYLRAVFAPQADVREDLLLHSRQKILVQAVLESVEETSKIMTAGHSEEMAVESLRRALPVLGKLTGEIRSQEVIDDIFSRFCIGK